MEFQMIQFVIILLSLNLVFASVPVWDFNSLSIDLLGSETSYDYIIYNKAYDSIKATLTKKIKKNENGITIENILTVDNESINVPFDDIDSHYHNKLGRSIIICPKGSFHPYEFYYDDYIKAFDSEGNWELSCYKHDTGYFLVIYAHNGNNTFYYVEGNNRNYKKLDSFYEFIVINYLNMQIKAIIININSLLCKNKEKI